MTVFLVCLFFLSHSFLKAASFEKTAKVSLITYNQHEQRKDFSKLIKNFNHELEKNDYFCTAHTVHPRYKNQCNLLKNHLISFLQEIPSDQIYDCNPDHTICRISTPKNLLNNSNIIHILFFKSKKKFNHILAYSSISQAQGKQKKNFMGILWNQKILSLTALGFLRSENMCPTQEIRWLNFLKEKSHMHFVLLPTELEIYQKAQKILYTQDYFLKNLIYLHPWRENLFHFLETAKSNTSLQQILRNNIFNIIYDLIKEIDALHTKKWIHRDIKLDNILLKITSANKKIVFLNDFDHMDSINNIFQKVLSFNLHKDINEWWRQNGIIHHAYACPWQNYFSDIEDFKKTFAVKMISSEQRSIAIIFFELLTNAFHLISFHYSKNPFSIAELFHYVILKNPFAQNQPIRRTAELTDMITFENKFFEIFQKVKINATKKSNAHLNKVLNLLEEIIFPFYFDNKHIPLFEFIAFPAEEKTALLFEGAQMRAHAFKKLYTYTGFVLKKP